MRLHRKVLRSILVVGTLLSLSLTGCDTETVINAVSDPGRFVSTYGQPTSLANKRERSSPFTSENYTYGRYKTRKKK